MASETESALPRTLLARPALLSRSAARTKCKQLRRQLQCTAQMHKQGTALCSVVEEQTASRCCRRCRQQCCLRPSDHARESKQRQQNHRPLPLQPTHPHRMTARTACYLPLPAGAQTHQNRTDSRYSDPPGTARTQTPRRPSPSLRPRSGTDSQRTPRTTPHRAATQTDPCRTPCMPPRSCLC